jgi:hypothetical protein|tara:strand:- start:44 stop:694 length:651 start_codon:yes stop_codon:yes gene_type:complete
MTDSNPIIAINVLMASKGHQIGRLVASCRNVVWYDAPTNGEHPWLPSSGILNDELGHFHFDRRFKDDTTIPPALDYARRSGYINERPELNFEKCGYGLNKLIYVTHSKLDEAKDYFKGKHLVVLDKNIERFFDTSWNYRVGKTKKLVSELYTREECIKALEDTHQNYIKHTDANDFVINSLDDLLVEDTFKLFCNKFNLGFDKTRYDKVKGFLTGV